MPIPVHTHTTLQEDDVATAYDDVCILYTASTYGVSLDILECLSVVINFSVDAIRRR